MDEDRTGEAKVTAVMQKAFCECGCRAQIAVQVDAVVSLHCEECWKSHEHNKGQTERWP